MKKIVSFIGARPQFIKEALLGKRVRQQASWKHILVHSGQHYDSDMSDIFFAEFGIPQPDYHLGIGSCSHTAMTAKAMLGLESVLQQEKPDAIMLYGDTNTTLAGALTASKMNIPIVHVEAGIRMHPLNMPEEINRRLVDRVSSLLCCCSELAEQNLAREGIAAGVKVTGDIMYDVFLHMRRFFSSVNMAEKLNFKSANYIVATIHRDYNVDTPGKLAAILAGLNNVCKLGYQVLFPVHPRTERMIGMLGLRSAFSNVTFLPPLGYIELMSLIHDAEFVITDSGGLQKESYYAGKRAIVVMPDTGWRELIDNGWNILCPADADCITYAAVDFKASEIQPPAGIYGNGSAVERIISEVLSFLH